MLKSRQVAMIPAWLDYTHDLSAMDGDRLEWERLPPLALSWPDLDEDSAQYLRDGFWITGPAQESLTRENTAAVERQAAIAAAYPALMTLARTAAKDTVGQYVTVEVRLDGEPALR